MKKYMVNDIKEALEQIKKDLGEDAIILSTRSVKKGGFLGIGAKRFLEVTAVCEDKDQVKTESSEVYKLQELLVKNKEKKQEEEIKELKQMLQEMKLMLGAQRLSDMPQNLQKVLKGLQGQEIDQTVSSRIIEYLRISYGDVNIDDSLRQRLAEHFLAFIRTEIPNFKGVTLFSGPTGVGKTTTLAKIAARLKIVEKKQVAILTLDTYRIAATDQLKTYATIMDIPMRVAYTPKEARLELEAMKSFDVVLIDTAGRSQNNDMQMSELRALFDVIQPNLAFLVISMNCRLSDLKDILERFGTVRHTHLILTKMDETRTFGHLINASMMGGIPVAFITNGQRVPEDIVEANAKDIAFLLSKEVLRIAQSS